MAEEKKVEAVEEAAEKPAKKKAAPKAKKAEVTEPAEKPAKKAAKKKAEPEVKEPSFPEPSAHDFDVIIAPHITEKTMALMQNANKVTVKVAKWANKVEVKLAFERIFKVQVVDVKISNQVAKKTTRGGRYQGTISGFKKAVVTLAEGSAIDLFKE